MGWVDFVRRSPEVAMAKRAKSAFAKATADEGGAGGSRTLVQTSSKNAFYMLSLLLVFEHKPEKSTPLMS